MSRRTPRFAALRAASLGSDSSLDASSLDASSSDASDASSSDASSSDASSLDASSRDASSRDASSRDASSRHASSRDASSRDASSRDASSRDASSPSAFLQNAPSGAAPTRAAHIRGALLRPAVAVRALGAAAAVAACLACAACGSDDVPSSEMVRPEHRDVVFQGHATDDALTALLATDPGVSDNAYPYFATPADGAELVEPLLFTWKLADPEARNAPAPAGGPAAPGAPGHADPNALGHAAPGHAAPGHAAPGHAAPDAPAHAAPAGAPAASPWRTAFGPLLELVGPIREAHAAAPPLDGRAYFAVFSTDEDDALLRVFTTEGEYMPDAAAWAKLTSTPLTISGWLLTGDFAGDALVQNGGPFSGGWVQFTVQR